MIRKWIALVILLLMIGIFSSGCLELTRYQLAELRDYAETMFFNGNGYGKDIR